MPVAPAQPNAARISQKDAELEQKTVLLPTLETAHTSRQRVSVHKTRAHQPEQPASLALVSCTALRKIR
ncbi:hypothetical protein HaLaN_04580 [Haematococcus lacustris]|uniref:Uncharacterized protein n=1 Tax=Haematococcus lacustris TaxID=44745 RepID=A0A699YGV4_HAELA|nr:hypothetical protein HaLaN_04580 [Haematococcus lacustris]